MVYIMRGAISAHIVQLLLVGWLAVGSTSVYAFRANAEVAYIKTLFPPDDNVYAELKQLIEHEQRCIYIAAYRLTDDDIASSIHAAAQRGVAVEIVADASALEARHNRILEMPKHGVSVYVFPPIGPSESHQEKRISKTALMHNKFMLFGSENIVWTGSFNFTSAARSTNQENVVIMQNQHQFSRYVDYFSLLKQRSTSLWKLFRRLP